MATKKKSKVIKTQKKKKPSYDLQARDVGPAASDHFKSTQKRLASMRELLLSRRVMNNEPKKRIAIDMLERYTGHSIDQFEKQVILTNFH